MTRYPLQPMVFDKRRVLRFKENKIVRTLLDTHPTLDLNRLHCMEFSAEDWCQFNQLIGCSVDGFLDLSCVRRAEYDRVWREYSAVLDGRKKKAKKK